MDVSGDIYIDSLTEKRKIAQCSNCQSLCQCNWYKLNIFCRCFNICKACDQDCCESCFKNFGLKIDCSKKYKFPYQIFNKSIELSKSDIRVCLHCKEICIIEWLREFTEEMKIR